MHLTELEPKFLIHNSDTSYTETDDITLADGIIFLCPVCFTKNGGNKGTHSIVCWQPHVPQTTRPVPGRWVFTGTGYNDLSLTAESSSILLDKAACKAHFFITDGDIRIC